jgi:hypothetical protein
MPFASTRSASTDTSPAAFAMPAATMLPSGWIASAVARTLVAPTDAGASA